MLTASASLTTHIRRPRLQVLHPPDTHTAARREERLRETQRPVLIPTRRPRRAHELPHIHIAQAKKRRQFTEEGNSIQRHAFKSHFPRSKHKRIIAEQNRYLDSALVNAHGNVYRPETRWHFGKMSVPTSLRYSFSPPILVGSASLRLSRNIPANGQVFQPRAYVCGVHWGSSPDTSRRY